jgi:hypothetical protein
MPTVTPSRSSPLGFFGTPDLDRARFLARFRRNDRARLSNRDLHVAGDRLAAGALAQRPGPNGDTSRLLRMHSDLVQRAVETPDRGATFDVDTIDELRDLSIRRRS